MRVSQSLLVHSLSPNPQIWLSYESEFRCEDDENESERSALYPHSIYGTFGEKLEKESQSKSPLLGGGGVKGGGLKEEGRRKGTVGLKAAWTYLKYGNSVFRILFLLLIQIGAQALLSYSDLWLSIW